MSVFLHGDSLYAATKTHWLAIKIEYSLKKKHCKHYEYKGLCRNLTIEKRYNKILHNSTPTRYDPILMASYRSSCRGKFIAQLTFLQKGHVDFANIITELFFIFSSISRCKSAILSMGGSGDFVLCRFRVETA